MINDYFVPLYFIERKIIQSPIGGYSEEFTKGAEFLGSVTHSNSVQVLQAEQQGVTATYRLYTSKEVPLKNNDIIYRSDTGTYVKVVDIPGQNVTPNNSTMNIQVVRAENWELPPDTVINLQ